MRAVIFLNGPPGSGKDFLGQALIHARKEAQAGGKYWAHAKLATALKDAVHTIHGVGELSTDHYEGAAKEQPSQTLFGKTPRQSYIDLSETMKRVWGRDFFGKVASREIFGSLLKFDIVITDCGFPEEIVPIVTEASTTIPYTACYLVRLYRKGKHFKGDSRNYIPEGTALRLFGNRVLDFVNDSDDGGKGFIKEVYAMIAKHEASLGGWVNDTLGLSGTADESQLSLRVPK